MEKQEVFKQNPNLKEVHMTSDGEMFYNDNDARMHAKSLKDTKVELVKNPDFLEVVSEEVDGLTTPLTDQEKAAAELAESKKPIDFSKMKKADLLQYANDNEIVVDETATNKVLVETIEAHINAQTQE